MRKMTTPQATESPDFELLDRYVVERDEAAFRILVERHADHVHSVALRVTASKVLAEDITQAVFVRLAQKAAVLPQRVPLAAWLHRTGRSLAIDTIRAEERRKKREHAAFLANPAETTRKSPVWAELAPVIDELVDRLPALDRDILLLRYYDNRSLQSIGCEHGLTEDTTGKRAARALEKLRVMLGKRGILTSTIALETLLPAHAAVPTSQTLALAIVSAIRNVAPAAPGIFNSILITTMTAKTITATVATIVLLGSAAYLTVGNYKTPGNSNGRPTEADADSRRTASAMNKETQGRERMHYPLRSQRSADSRATAAPPSGIGPIAWNTAGNILEQLSNGKFLLNEHTALPADKIKELQKVLGLDDAAVTMIFKLVSERTASEEKRSAGFLQQQLAESSDLQTLFALGEQKKVGDLTPEQDALRDEIGGRYADLFGNFQKELMPWYDDYAFLDDVKGTLQPADAAGFDSFVQTQSEAIREAQAFEKSQELSTRLNLDREQRQAIHEEISNNNPDAIASHLRPEQLEIYDRMQNEKTLNIRTR
jgi:RNA polymerase sigma factor (sigma-70 family)